MYQNFGVAALGPVSYTRMRVVDNATDMGKFSSTSNANRYAQPSPDGALLFLPGATIYDGRSLNQLPTDALDGRSCRPTADPRYFLAIRFVEENGNAISEVAICTTGDLRTIYTARGFGEMAPRGNTNERRRYVGQLHSGVPRWIYLPTQNLFATLGIDDQHVYLRRFNLKQQMDASGSDYLWVVSKPESVAITGKAYHYVLETLSKSNGLNFKLESGPKQMTLSKSGRITWTPRTRPIGGMVEVIVSVSNRSGLEAFHAFTIDVERSSATRSARASDSRPTRGAANDAAPKSVPGTRHENSDRFVKIDDRRIETPTPSPTIVDGLNHRWLILSGSRMAVVAPDGITIELDISLPNTYVDIGERHDYYVAISNESKSVDIIDKKTLKVIRTRNLTFMQLTDLALHPTRSLSYVAFKRGIEPPRYQFIVFDESTTDGREGEDLIGQWLLVEPRGRWMISGYRDLYQSGSDLITNPSRWHLVPRYGSLDWLIRYDIGPRGNPVFSQLKQEVGGNGKGIRMSADGQRITYLSHIGHPVARGNLAGWDPEDLEKLPVIYETKGRATTHDVAFHPFLPLVASPAEHSVSIFHRETGALEENRLKLTGDTLATAKIHRVYFSPDGRNVIFDTSVNDIHYLHRVDLRLSTAEIDQIERAIEQRSVRPKPAVRVRLKDLDALRRAATSESLTPKEVGRRYMNAVVLIERDVGSGTGFVIGRSGFIITCAHVLSTTDQPTVSFKNEEGAPMRMPAQIVSVDDAKDLALLEILRCRLFFLADVTARGTTTYLVLYGNSDAPDPAYETDLSVSGEGYALQIENEHYRAVLSELSGNWITVK